MDAYNPALDRVSDGAKHAQQWSAYKENGSFGGEGDTADRKPNDADVVQEEKKEYGKHYPSVWTKEPHGGAYRIDKGPGSRKGYDALEQKSDGTLIERPAGYEKPQTGPTTNFVGNHMTQGAIDLVQYELTKIDPNRDLRHRRLTEARGIEFKPPELLAVSVSETTNQRKRRGIESFSWYDGSETIRIAIPMHTLVNARFDRATLCCGEKSALIEIPSVSLCASDCEDVYVLHFKHLFGSIVPERAHHAVDKQHFVVHLAKKELGLSWSTIESASEVVQALPFQQSVSSVATMQPKLDLLALRRQVISAREGQLANQLIWLKESERKIGEDVDRLESMSAVEAIRIIQLHVNAGDYCRALDTASCGLMDANISNDDKVTLLSQRAKIHVQLGAFKAAVSDYNVLFDIEPSLATLLQNANVREQLEDYEGALEIYAKALKLDPSCSHVHTSMRRVNGFLTQRNVDDERARQKTNVNESRSVPRPCLPQFENRGKAGACF